MAEISQNVNIEMLEKLPDGTYKRKYPATKAEVVKLVDAQNKFTNKNVEGAMNELFTNVSSGKELVGGAITDVDDSVVIPTDPTFGDLASAIGGISTGKKWASGTVATITSSSGLSISGLTFRPSVIIWWTTVSSSYYFAGYYNEYDGFPYYLAQARVDVDNRSVIDNKSKVIISDSSFTVFPGLTATDVNWIAFE